VVDVEEDHRGRVMLVVTQLPYMCNPDNLAAKIAELVNAGRIGGIAELRDDTSARTGQRLVIVLKRDAQPKVVMNNLFKHTGLQDSFGCNMLALVDDVPRTLRLDQFIGYWVRHQIDVIVRRTRFRIAEAEKRAHVWRGYVAALDNLDAVIALIRRSRDADVAKAGLMELLTYVDAGRLLNGLGHEVTSPGGERSDEHTGAGRPHAAVAGSTGPAGGRGESGADVARLQNALAAGPADGGATYPRVRHIDEVQATAILDLQWRRLAAMERQRIIDQLTEIETRLADLRDILDSPARQRRIIADELREIVDKYGDERRTRIISADGDLNDEDLIPDEDDIVTITIGGYAKRTRADNYRLQRRGGKGVRGATLRSDDEVAHLFATSSHDWLLFFTTKGRVYRARVWQIPEGGRDAKGGHVAGLLSFQPDEKIAQVLTLRTYDDAAYLLLATRSGLVKKSDLKLFDTNRSAGVIAINFRDDDDELIGAALCDAGDDVLLVSCLGQAIRFQATDDELRPMGRATSGVTGMRFREGDSLLSMTVIPAGTAEDERYVFTVTDGGYAKRTPVSEYRLQGRGGLGVKAMKLPGERGSLVGGLVVGPTDEVIAIKVSGQIIRSSVADVSVTGRDTMGVTFVKLTGDDKVAVIAQYPSSEDTSDDAGSGATESPSSEETTDNGKEGEATEHSSSEETSDSPDETAEVESPQKTPQPVEAKNEE